jgi:hypothetical protein
VHNMSVIYTGLLHRTVLDYTPIASTTGVCESGINALG